MRNFRQKRRTNGRPMFLTTARHLDVLAPVHTWELYGTKHPNEPVHTWGLYGSLTKENYLLRSRFET